MSQTMIYLEENGLLDLDTLNEQAATASATYHDLSKKIKSAEQRMTEIKILQQHIVNYSKTRNIYVGYRKAGYSNKYLAEHEADILLHKAAKKYFDDQGLEKLPTYQSLQKEYAELMAQKKSMYSDYKKAQEKMRELQTSKANVDRILNMEITEAEKKKKRSSDKRSAHSDLKIAWPQDLSCVSGDWGSASTSRKPPISASAGMGGLGHFWPQMHCLPIL